MSGTVVDRIRLIRVTEGNLKNHHLYVTGQYDFFPPDCIGENRKNRNGNGRTKPIQIFLEGLNATIETDIGTDVRTGKPRRMFRGRKWVREFFEYHAIKAGDWIGLERIAARSFRLFAFETRHTSALDRRLSPLGTLTRGEGGHAPVAVARQKKGFRSYDRTRLGESVLGDALDVLERKVESESADLIVTSPPFGLVRKKDYGNVDAEQYVDWFRAFGKLFRRALKPTGSLVIDIGGAWVPGQPTRSLYHYELLIMLCRDCGFHLAQEFFWWNPAKLPTPAEWVTVRRIRVKDAVNCVWWLSPTPWPKASNRRVLVPYSDSMRALLKNGYRAKLRPSGHDISEKFSIDNGAAIPPNIIALAHTESNSYYLRYCKEHGIKPHPARFPAEIPEYFIRMLTDPGDLVIDPFAGSCVTGEVAERLDRKWLCVELVEEYLRGALGRFHVPPKQKVATLFPYQTSRQTEYKLSHPGATWGSEAGGTLPLDGGRKRSVSRKALKSVTARETA